MKLSSILLTIIGRIDGERTIYAGLHLLRGKRSGQTLQDVEYYGLKEFFGIVPKLTAERFDEAANQLRDWGFISTMDDSFVKLTEQGRMEAGKSPTYRFNGWDYRGREMIFYGRLSLAVQTVSNFKAKHKSFMPAQKDRDIQSFVKMLLHNQRISDPVFADGISEEIRLCLTRSEMDERQKIIITHRLSGFGLTGWTWDQLAEKLKLNPFDIRLLFIEGLHMMLAVIIPSSDLPFLRKLADSVKVSTYLTDSSVKTKRLFDRGFSLDEIVTARNLKKSTIEDHFVEMSINDAEFPLTQFVSAEDAEAVAAKVKEIGTRRLRLLKSEFEKLSYFQLRLILGARTGGGN
ncbi:helix-turn-helix domain-containing protein [Sporosarcina sp. E16_8]|uniref:helix-turn-helix domain-containing protein n=1 Tax=Sporosarcina sp. E16_8 TaxID=2789295 RepID=UPI001A90CEF9|nr:helix-turn-helix domain-containing protein [Sporosarcina sp. E16_8]MBO0586609.1 helix-turn-helix domain-containing protein [Sporosarcina sp. E16_8]